MTTLLASLLGTALITLLAAGLLDVVAGIARPSLRPLPYLLAAAASGLLALVGAAVLGGTSIRLGLDSALGSGAWAFGEVGLLVDPLAGLFLVISFGVAVPVCCACAAWAARPGRVRSRGVAAAHCLCLGAVALVITADNAFLFLMAWELLTVSFYLLTGFARRDAQRAAAAVITVVAGRVSGAALLVGMLLLAGHAHSVEFAQLALLPRSGLRDTAFALLVAGFSVKIGLVPLHVWMPRGYWAAPARSGPSWLEWPSTSGSTDCGEPSTFFTSRRAGSRRHSCSWVVSPRCSASLMLPCTPISSGSSPTPASRTPA